MRIQVLFLVQVFTESDIKIITNNFTVPVQYSIIKFTRLLRTFRVHMKPLDVLKRALALENEMFIFHFLFSLFEQQQQQRGEKIVVL
jgi:hypothetical protein